MGALTSKVKQGAALCHKTQTAVDKFVKEDPDEKWSNLYREKQRNHLYKWVDDKGHGELLTIYEKEGEEGVHRFASNVLPQWLYNDGIMPENLSQDDYVKWRKTVHANLTGGEDISQSDILDSIGGKYVEHAALWRLNKRGMNGETVIHLLLAQDDAKCTDIAKIILRIHPNLAVDIHEGEEFYGQSPLHQAIVHDDYECVQILVTAGADLTQRAIGTFFLPEDQKTTPKAKSTNYAGFAYYGEYPLAFAASFGNKDIYDFLIQQGADPNWQDSFGNTVLHMCVINNSIEMYSYAVRHWAKPADDNICNHAGYTPLTLATILGRKEIFEAMLELTKVEFWRFSDMTYSGYPLTTLDTIRADGSTNWDSALMRVVNGNTTSHLDIVGCDVIQRLLADKWRLFGERKMYERMAFHIIHIICLSVAIYTRPVNAAENLLNSTAPIAYVRYCAESATLIFTLHHLLYQQISEIRAQGLASYVRSMSRAPEKLIFLAANFLILLAVPCRFLPILGYPDVLPYFYLAEEACLTLAVPGFWISFLFFSKGFLMTGPFVVMIYSMVAGDMLRFGSIVVIFLISFSQAFFFLCKDVLERDQANLCGYDYDTPAIDYEYYLETALTLFRMALGGYDYEKLYCATYTVMARLLFVLYMIIMPIMLINMLIAAMGNTYERVISHAEKAWRQQWAQIVILLERSLDKKKLAQLQQEYSIKLNDDRYDDNDGDASDVRGLMVIKQTKQTKAKQRKQATSGWKRLGRKVFAMMRNLGTDKTKQALHNRFATVMESRPASRTGLLQLTDGHHSTDNRFSSVITNHTSQYQSKPRPTLNIVHTDTEQSLLNCPIDKPPSRPESPKLVVHHEKSSIPSRTHSSLDNEALMKKLNSLDVESENPTKTDSAKKKLSAVVDEFVTMPLSSPASLSDCMAIDTVLNGQEIGTQTNRRVSTSESIQLHPLALEQLPNLPQRGGSRKMSASSKKKNGRFVENPKANLHRRSTAENLIAKSDKSTVSVIASDKKSVDKGEK